MGDVSHTDTQELLHAPRPSPTQIRRGLARLSARRYRGFHRRLLSQS